MEINLTLLLPRDAVTVPMVRHLCKFALGEVGVSTNCISDVELAVTEACGNVVRHATADDEYEVKVSISLDRCEIRVIDAGRGVDVASLDGTVAHPSAESGRGVQLMRALVDAATFTSEPESGTMVHLVKDLAYDEGTPSPALR